MSDATIVWDVFPYWREHWAVEARRALWAHFAPEVDHRLIILTGDRTHRGQPLPLPPDLPNGLVLPLPGQRQAGRHEMLMRVILDSDTNWGREAQQRDAVTMLLPRMGDEDLVLICDADELVDPRQLAEILNATARGPRKLEMDLYVFGTRWRHAVRWVHPAAFRAKHMPQSPSALRFEQTIAAVPMAGWHFSYVGTDEEISEKLAAFAHAEFDTAEYRELIRRCRETGADSTGKALFDDPIDPVITKVLEAAGVAF